MRRTKSNAAPRATWTRATRLAAFAFNASLVTTVACTSDSDTGTNALADASIDVCCDGPVYGLPPFDAYVEDPFVDAADGAADATTPNEAAVADADGGAKADVDASHD